MKYIEWKLYKDKRQVITYNITTTTVDERVHDIGKYTMS